MAGAVLCGGRSERMGRDKAFIEIDGVPMVRRVAAALRGAGATPVVTVGGDAGRLRSLGFITVDDDEPGAGPLGGIVSALRALTGGPGGAGRVAGRPPPHIVLVAACDLVAPAAAAWRATVDALASSPGAAVAVPTLGGRRQWVHAAWRVTASGSLGAVAAAGERSVHGAVALAGLTVVEVRGLDPAALADADEPADLRSRH